MKRQSKELADTLQRVGAVLVRHSKHYIYRLPNGRTYVLSSTTGDHRQMMNAIKGLQRTAALPTLETPCQHS
jgi:hypothetical protein